MKIILYTTNCPKCRVLETKLEKANLPYERIDDVDTMQSKGFMSAPMLEVDGEAMDFVKANDWVNNQ